jgi:hypothetical protein
MRSSRRQWAGVEGRERVHEAQLRLRVDAALEREMKCLPQTTRTARPFIDLASPRLPVAAKQAREASPRQPGLPVFRSRMRTLLGTVTGTVTAAALRRADPAAMSM